MEYILYYTSFTQTLSKKKYRVSGYSIQDIEKYIKNGFN